MNYQNHSTLAGVELQLNALHVGADSRFQASNIQAGQRDAGPPAGPLWGAGEGRPDERILVYTLNSVPLAVDAGFRDHDFEGLTFRYRGDGSAADIEAFSKASQATFARIDRWALQSAAGEALRFALDGPHAAKLAGTADRLAKCCRVPLGDHVKVHHSSKTGAASYSNLTTCGSVWCCRVCSAKVSERRRQELGTGLDQWTKTGGRVWLLTLTYPHKVGDPLPDSLGAFTKARGKLWKGRAAQDDGQAWKLSGHVTALEVTVGKSGWHPHAHILLFLDSGSKADLGQVAARLQSRWQKVCIKAGLLDTANEAQMHGFSRNGLDLREGAEAANYVSKFGVDEKAGWDLSCELTKAHLKRGKGNNVTPWDLLRLYLADGDLDAAALFADYAAAFKGKQQLRYSPGLRKLLGVDEQEKTDEELAQEKGEADVLLAQLPLVVWRLVVRLGVRGLLLAVASSGDPADLWSYLNRLRLRYAPDLREFGPVGSCLDVDD